MQFQGCVTYAKVSESWQWPIVSKTQIINVSYTTVTIELRLETNTLYIPRGPYSSLKVNCTADSSLDPVWSIRLPDNEIFLSRIEDLPNFQELSMNGGMKKTSILHINSTDEINGTVIRCDGLKLGKITPISQATLAVYSTLYKYTCNHTILNQYFVNLYRSYPTHFVWRWYWVTNN